MFRVNQLPLPVLQKWIRRSVIGFTFAVLLAPLALLNSCSTIPRNVIIPTAIPGAQYTGNQSCFTCHTNYVRQFPTSPHARMHFAPNAKIGASGCEACHGPGSKHIEAGGGRGKFILNPGKDATACFNCHLETHAEFTLPQHHPVLEGKMNCVQCHDPHGADIMKPAGGLAMSRLNQSCAQCHRDQAKPFVFEHEALREGCTVCHSPHGSINAKMLIERDNNLCLKCHAQTQGPLVTGSVQIVIGREDHTDYLKLGGCWSAGCHPAVHGSNFNPKQRY
jgi:predicted CXXCH cytochrome family protein